MRRGKVLAGLLAGVMMAGQLFPLHAFADGYKVVTLGANLSEEQKDSILRFFGVSEGEVELLVITNEDERAQLQNLIPIEQIGTRTYSCALVNPTTSGGIQVKTANMNYVTSNMIAATLSTSGVVNCDVLTAAPFEVSGTGALTGVMMAYETASGETLDTEKKELANEELVTTNKIADTVGQDEATLIVNDIKIHIIRDELKEQEEVNTVVDTVVDTTQTATAKRAQEAGKEQPEQLQQPERELLYTFGYKVAQADYKYDDVKVTLQRVAQNVSEATGIQDPILDTFDELQTENLDSESILMNTDDDALGEDTRIDATNQDAVGDSLEEILARLPERAQGDQVSIERIGILPDADWISNTSLLRIRDSGGNSYMALPDGTALTGSLYSQFSGSFGYITAVEQTENGNYAGMFAQDGTILLPFRYDSVQVENQHWALGLTISEATADHYDVESYDGEHYFLIDTVDLYYLEQDTSSLAASLTRDQILEFQGLGRYINIQDRTSGVISCYDSSFHPVASGLKDIYRVPEGIYTEPYQLIEENGQQGLADAQGNVLIPPCYRYMEQPTGNYLVVSTGEKEGLMDLNGNLILPAEYDSVLLSYTLPIPEGTDIGKGYVANGYVAVERDDKLGFCDVNGNLTCDPTFSREVMEENGASASYTDMAGNLCILAADGQNHVVNGYEKISSLYYTSGMLYKTYDEEYDIGLIDWHGNELLPLNNGGIDVSANGQYLLVDVKGDSCLLYQITYSGPVFSGASLPVEGTKASTELETEPNDVPAEEAVFVPATEINAVSEPETAENAPSDSDEGLAVRTLLENAARLLEVGDLDAAKNMVNSAKLLVGAEQRDAAALLDGVLALLNAETADAGSVQKLIESALTLL